MIISALELKSALKKLSPVRNETFQIGSTISAQDPDIFVVVHRDLGLGETFNVNGRKLSQVIGRMSGQIEIERGEKSLLLKSARAKVELEIQRIKPVVLPKSPNEFLPLKTDEFKSALSVAQAAADTNKSTETGGCVQFRTQPLGLEEEAPAGYALVGSDGKQLTIVTRSATFPHEFSCLLNLEAAAAVQLMDGNLEFGEIANQLWFKNSDTTVIASRPQKAYPDYPRFVPTQFEFQIQYDAQEFLSALKTVESMIDESLDKGAVSLQIKENVVQLKTVNIGSGALDEVTCEQIYPDPVFDPKEFKIKLAAKYLSAYLSKASGPVKMSFMGLEKPVKLEYQNITTVVMPFGRT